MKILLLLVLLGAFINPPEPDPACISDWTPMWEFDGNSYCDGGHYELWACTMEKESSQYGTYTTIKYASTCGIIGEPAVFEPHILFIPTIRR